MTPRRRLLAGLAALAFAAVVRETAAQRIWVAIVGPERAHLVGCLGALALAAGALAAGVLPAIGRRRPSPHRLARATVAAAICTLMWVIYFAYLSNGKAGITLDAGSAPIILDSKGQALAAGLVALGTLPAVFVGFATTLGARSLSDAPRSFFAALLAGASAGAVPAVLAVRLGAPRAILIAAALLGLAAAVFQVPVRMPRPAQRRSLTTGIVATVVLGSLVLLGGDYGDPWLEYSLRLRGAPDRTEARVWTELGLLTVDKAGGGRSWVREDGRDVPPMLDSVAQPTSEPEDLAYTLHRGEGTALIVDAGGGRDVRAALKAGQKRVVATVLHPALLTLMRGDYRKKSGDVESNAGVVLAVDDGRRDLAALGAPFRSVVLPTSAGLAAAAFEVGLGGGLAGARFRTYTVDAWAEYLEALEPAGTLVAGGPSADFPQRVALAYGALSAVGAPSPKDHVFGCETKDDAALLVKRSPLSAVDLRTLRKHCKQQKMEEILAPDGDSVGASGVLPTDLRPFPGATQGGLGELLTRFRSRRASEAERALISAAFAGSMAAIVALLLAAVGRPRARGRVPVRLLASCLALGFALWTGAAATSREVVVALGHPVYALLFSMPALGFVGAVRVLTAPPTSGRDAGRALAQRGLVAAVLTVVLALGLHYGAEFFSPLPFGARLAVGLFTLGMVGWALGGLVTPALSAARASGAAGVPIAWAMVLVGLAFGATVGPLAVYLQGFGFLFVLVAAALFVASLATPSAKRLV